MCTRPRSRSASPHRTPNASTIRTPFSHPRTSSRASHAVRAAVQPAKRKFSGASGPLNVYLNPGLALDHGNLNRGLVVSTSDCTPPLTNPAPDEVQDDGQDKNADDPRERRRLSS
jgi:hypothetical protein